MSSSRDAGGDSQAGGWLCASCEQDIGYPCGIWERQHCQHCAGRIVDCHVCDGRGLNRMLLIERNIRVDCGACVGTGNMMICRRCDGRGFVRDHRGTVQCDACEERRDLRCQVCQAAGWVWIFLRFCPGDNSGPEGSRRRHPTSSGVPRDIWGRTTENDVVALNG
jgi:hypothetical protein